MAAREREEMASSVEQLGPEAPTLCEGWTVRDLVAHLVERESGSPAALGVAVPAVRGYLEDRRVRRASGDFAALVERFRSGPPRTSFFSVPGLDTLLNPSEFFIHHEDVRRAQPGWEPRALSVRHQDALWKLVRVAGRLAVVRVPTGVVAERAGTGEQVTLKKGSPAVIVRGEPAEVLLFTHGRRDHAQVELLGDESALAALRSTRLGV
ncbi:MAG: hypothetical protein AVDCRST_MAG24-1345 [uncultured Nocardioidaceae bacterium]|uniref:Mycothiol-dependent maleylpyruvate isomerase metal-binding domain-containing protein n=1 Tax=uncultured Nocardioidaceae bacterium TaxID=253824 RepID=A0A6J4LVY9_9ACTN|nr:MAG: hypothetical protein AVDCRST_MAG24-1345 [uncultured Nocardioidaceae bacterium]